MGSDDDPPQRDRWARLRFAVIGSLLAAPPPPGDLQSALHELAARTWRHPLTGLQVRFGASTIERWYYAARKAADPVSVLRNQIRRDIGRFPSFCAAAAEALRTQYTQHAGWNAKLHHDNLRVVLAAADPPLPCPSYPSVLRYLKAHGLTRKRPPRRKPDEFLIVPVPLAEREIRSYEVEYVLQLMHLDFHHGSRKVLTRAGEWVKPLLVAFIDDRSQAASRTIDGQLVALLELPRVHDQVAAAEIPRGGEQGASIPGRLNRPPNLAAPAPLVGVRDHRGVLKR